MSELGPNKSGFSQFILQSVVCVDIVQTFSSLCFHHHISSSYLFKVNLVACITYFSQDDHKRVESMPRTSCLFQLSIELNILLVKIIIMQQTRVHNQSSNLFLL